MFDKNRIIDLLRHFRIRPYLAYIARKSGYELVGDSRSWWQIPRYKLTPRILPNAIQDYSKDPYIFPFKIDINSITSRVGFSYNQKGWHPFVETLNEYALDNKLNFQNSTLSHLYKSFQPKNVQEAILGHYKKPLDPIVNWPPDNLLISRLWTLNKYSLRFYLNVLERKQKKQGWIFFGPHSIQYGNTEFKRLISVYNSIKQDGYMSDRMEKDPVNGYFLKKNDTYRFVLLQGNHRVSALKALGYSEVNAVIRPGHPTVIDWDNLDEWTEKKSGIYTKEIVLELFDSLFKGSGFEKALQHDLINKSMIL